MIDPAVVAHWLGVLALAAFIVTITAFAWVWLYAWWKDLNQ